MGRVSVEIETATLEAAFSADYYFSAPDSFRADIHGLLGTTAGAMISIGDSAVAYFPSKGTLFVAVGNPEEKNPVLGLRLGFSDLMKAMIGFSGIGKEDSLVLFDSDGEIYELSFDRGPEMIRLQVLPTVWVPSSKQVFTKDGVSTLDIGYYDFIESEGSIRAKRIIITNPVRGEVVKMSIEKEYIGRKLPEGLFEIDVPDDIEIWKLTQGVHREKKTAY